MCRSVPHTPQAPILISAAFAPMSGHGTLRKTGGAPGPAKVATRVVLPRMTVLPSWPGRAGAGPAEAGRIGAGRDAGVVSGGSLPPSRECVGESALARIALLDRHDGAPAVVVDDRNVEPGALLEELDVALLLGVDRRQAEQEE